MNLNKGAEIPPKARTDYTDTNTGVTSLGPNMREHDLGAQAVPVWEQFHQVFLAAPQERTSEHF